MKKTLLLTLALILLCKIGFSQSTIDPRLQTILNQKSEEMIPINIIFKSQIDLAKLKTRANTSLDKKVKRNIFVDEMKLFSEASQQEVLSILQSETRSYKVSDIKQHWLANAISCTADRNVIYLLSEHPDIEIIGYDEMVKMVPEESQQSTDNSQQTRNDEDDELYLTDNILMVNADKAWKMGYTGKGVIVAVIDSGVNYNHEDLKDHLWDGGAQYPNHGYNFIDDNNDPMDDYGHGTHCAGTVCGDGTAGINTGIAPDATLMCLKALNNKGTGNVSSISNAMQFAIENHADIINMSLGIPNPSVTDKTMLRRICDNALELGVIASVAAGNYGNKTDLYQIPNNILAPADCPPPWLHPDQQANKGGLSCVVSVGAIDWWEKIYEGSSQGPVTWTNTEFNDYPYGGDNIGLIRPDVCAPGVGIKSLDHNNNNDYNLKSGTSMAAPCVAGVMALMLEQKPNLTPAEICEILETTAKKLSDTKSNMFGSGLIDAFKALGGEGNEDGNDDPETPVDPEQPGDEPEQPTDPETPVDPEQPGDEPEQPTDPETPVDPEQPGDEPGEPTDPETPVDPEQPGDEPETSYTVTVVVNPENAGTITGAGTYKENDTVTLTATANDGYKFIRWIENNMGVSSETEYSFVITSDIDLVAKFEKTEEPEQPEEPGDEPEEPGDEPEEPGDEPEQPGESVEELTSSFRLYPNPANDKLYIETPTMTQTPTLTVEIYDVYGRQQTTDNGQQLSCIDVSKLDSGVYFVKVITSNGEVVKRFVKQ